MDIEDETWWLDNAESRAAEAPHSFFIPAVEKRSALRVGDGVKLIFRFSPSVDGYDAERMWVGVTGVEPDSYTGTLLNQPRYMRSLQEGAQVTFGAEHVAAYVYTAEELGYDPDLLAWVRRDASIPRGERPIRVSMRPAELRNPENDSGWIMGRGDEEASEYTDPDVFDWCDIGWLSDLYPELEDVYRVGEGDWRWDDLGHAFVRVDESPPE